MVHSPLLMYHINYKFNCLSEMKISQWEWNHVINFYKCTCTCTAVVRTYGVQWSKIVTLALNKCSIQLCVSEKESNTCRSISFLSGFLKMLSAPYCKTFFVYFKFLGELWRDLKFSQEAWMCHLWLIITAFSKCYSP